MIKKPYKPCNYLVRIFLNYIHLRNIGGYFMEKGTRFFYKLMLLFNSKVRKYRDKFFQMYINLRKQKYLFM